MSAPHDPHTSAVHATLPAEEKTPFIWDPARMIPGMIIPPLMLAAILWPVWVQNVKPANSAVQIPPTLFVTGTILSDESGPGGSTRHVVIKAAGSDFKPGLGKIEFKARAGGAVDPAALEALLAQPVEIDLNLTKALIPGVGIGVSPAAAPNVRALNLSQTKLTSPYLTSLRRFTQLKKLSLAETDITDADFVQAGGLRELESLDLSRTKISGDGLNRLRNPAALAMLDLSFTPFDDAGATALARFTGLRRLDLTRTAITGATLNHLTPLSKLESLRLGHTSIDGPALAAIPAESMREISLSGLKFAPGDLAPLGAMTQLAQLDLDETPADDASLEFLAPLVNLEQLSLRASGVTGPGLVHLGGMKRLAVLNLQSTKLKTSNLTALGVLTGLRNLNLAETPLTDKTMPPLGQLIGLQYLSLARTRIGDAGVESIKPLVNLRVLDLTQTRVTESGIAGLKAALPRCQILSPKPK